ncbi:MAG: hypothetical protein L3K26_12185 [Candidatus Hydrogenedentes bacterium]|nr:hypothetical protein [Candidatus Hydrogenedentota bacterium]
MYYIYAYDAAAPVDRQLVSISTDGHTASPCIFDSKTVKHAHPQTVCIPKGIDCEKRGPRGILDRLWNLENGWDSYSAPAPVADTIVRARSLVDDLLEHDVSISHIGPSLLGGIGITVDHEGTEFAVEFRNSGKAIVTEITADDDIKIHNLTGCHGPAHEVLAILGKEAG